MQPTIEILDRIRKNSRDNKEEIFTRLYRYLLRRAGFHYGRYHAFRRNILYVAVTRAIKNLRILYIDDLEEIRDSMEKVFGKIYEFSNGITKEEF